MKHTNLIIIGGGFIMCLVPSFGELSRSTFGQASRLFLATFGTWTLFWGVFLLALRLYTRPKLEPGEKFIKAEWGSCYAEDGVVGGMLYLTGRRLIFRSHFFHRKRRFNYQTTLQEIVNIARQGKRIEVMTKQEQPIAYWMNDSQEWLEKLRMQTLN